MEGIPCCIPKEAEGINEEIKQQKEEMPKLQLPTLQITFFLQSALCIMDMKDYKLFRIFD